MKNGMRFFAILVSLFVGAQVWASEFIVKYKSDSLKNVSGFISSQGIRILDQHSTGRLLKVKIDPKNEVALLAQLMGHRNVEYVVKDFKVRAFNVPPSAMALKKQWALEKIKAEKAWGLAGNRGSRQVIVAVTDTGMDYNHESLKKNAVTGYDFIKNNTDPMDKTSSANPGHGTHCAGIIGATGDANDGVSGMVQEVSLMPLRFLDENGSGDLMNAVKAIDHAIKAKADIISASWGATVSRAQAQPIVDAVKRADDAGVIFIAAAANDGKNNDKTEVYPANAGFPNTITVAASASDDSKPSWSNYGTANVHMASPGHEIMSTLPGNKYGNLSGTSMATPLVSGLAAFIKAQDRSITGQQLRALLQATGANVGIDTACNCRIDAEAATQAVLNKTMIVVPNAATLAPQETQQFSTLYGQAPFTFASSNASVATITDTGLLTAVADGETTVTVKDASGKTATSLKIRVAQKNSGGGGGGGGGGACPIGDPATCDALCQIMPDLPFCSGN